MQAPGTRVELWFQDVDRAKRHYPIPLQLGHLILAFNDCLLSYMEDFLSPGSRDRCRPGNDQAEADVSSQPLLRSEISGG